MSTEINGVEALQKRLDGIATKVAKAAIRKGTRAGAKIIQAAAKNSAPVRTGTLKKNIKVRSMPRSRRYVGTTVRSTGEGYYGSFVNYGTKKQKAKRFLNTTAGTSKGTAISEAVQTAADYIEANA